MYQLVLGLQRCYILISSYTHLGLGFQHMFLRNTIQPATQSLLQIFWKSQKKFFNLLLTATHSKKYIMHCVPAHTHTHTHTHNWSKSFTELTLCHSIWYHLFYFTSLERRYASHGPLIFMTHLLVVIYILKSTILEWGQKVLFLWFS